MKRVFDIVGALCALLLLSPLLAIVALAVRIVLGAPVLFRQQRPGLHGRPFTLIKFRSMRTANKADGTELDDAQRLTAFGRLLRRSSLDELPELVNVLRGDMSLVGPRPLLMEYLPLYRPWQARRHEVRPGITGLAQVRGRNSLSWDDRFRLDVWYVDHHTLWLDLRIIAMTVGRVLTTADVAQSGHATAQKFTGGDAPRREHA
jgi:sugar transferase EpsL